MPNKSIFITGGAGFIGAAITIALIKCGHKVTVFDDFSRGSSSRLEEFLKDCTIVNGDVRDLDKLRSSFNAQEVFIHLAYINGTKNFYSRPKEVLDTGIIGMQNVCELLSHSEVQEFYLASSSEVYQEPDHFPTTEEVELRVPNPRNPRYSYGLGKIVQEFMTFNYLTDIPKKVVFRPHNVYGPNMGFDHIIPEIFRKVLNDTDKKIQILGDGNQTRSFCHIDDFVRGFKLLFQSQVNGVFNLGNDTEISIRKLVEKIAFTVGTKSELIFTSAPVGETRRRVPDISRIRDLGYRAEIQLEEGLQNYLTWYKKSVT